MFLEKTEEMLQILWIQAMGFTYIRSNLPQTLLLFPKQFYQGLLLTFHTHRRTEAREWHVTDSHPQKWLFGSI